MLRPEDLGTEPYSANGDEGAPTILPLPALGPCCPCWPAALMPWSAAS